MQTITAVEYPETDGMPMGETDLHRMWMIRIYDLLKWRYRDQNAYVGSDLLLYYIEGEPWRFVVPDDFVVLDCDPGPRRIFKTWEEGKAPNVVFEVTSRATRQRDESVKPQMYGEMGVRELFLYDPTADYLDPPLQGFRFAGRELIDVPSDSSGALRCDELDLILRLDRGELVLLDAPTGQPLLTEAETHLAALQAEQARRQSAEVRAAAAEEELRRLRQQRTTDN